jgi:hypothetical protein
MKYTKPEVAVLGKAARVIEARTAKVPPYVYIDLPFAPLNAAYDLDE